jgi:hypothetical protein
MGLAGQRPAFFDKRGEISNLSGCFSAENNGTVAGVAGHSGLMGFHEERTLTRPKAVRRIAVDPMIAEHCSRVVKTTVSPFHGIAKTSFRGKDT